MIYFKPFWKIIVFFLLESNDKNKDVPYCHNIGGECFQETARDGIYVPDGDCEAGYCRGCLFFF